jgi:hypothetical protein
LRAVTGGALLISMNFIDRIIIQRCIFENNSGLQVGADITIELTSKLSWFSDLRRRVPMNGAWGLFGNIFRGSSGGEGGSITIFENTQVFMEQNIFENSNAEIGGAIRVRDTAELTIYNSTFTGGRAIVAGGSLYISGGILVVIETKFSDGLAEKGGSIYLESSIVTLLISLFNNNTAGKGGVLFTLTTSLTLNSVEFLRSKSGSAGGSINSKRGTLDMKHVDFIENWSHYNGGALHLEDLSELSILSIFTFGNQAFMDGIIYIYGNDKSKYFLSDLKCVNNSVSGEGSCLYLINTVFVLQKIVVQNCEISNSAFYLLASMKVSNIFFSHISFDYNNFTQCVIYVSEADVIFANINFTRNKGLIKGFSFFKLKAGRLSLNKVIHQMSPSEHQNRIGGFFLNSEKSYLEGFNLDMRFRALMSGFKAQQSNFLFKDCIFEKG